MRNIDKLKEMISDEANLIKIAELLVHHTSQPDYDYVYDGEDETFEYCGEETIYITPCGAEYYDFENAVEATCIWLLSEDKGDIENGELY